MNMKIGSVVFLLAVAANLLGIWFPIVKANPITTTAAAAGLMAAALAGTKKKPPEDSFGFFG